MLADWFARKNIEDTIIITVPFQVRSITDKIIPQLSGSVFLRACQADQRTI